MEPSFPHVALGFPDVCKTPAPGGPVPIPYPNAGPMATGWETTNAVQRVKLQSDHGLTATKASGLTSSTGDEAGTMKNVVSAVNAGKVKHTQAAFNVKAEGAGVLRSLGTPLGRF